MYLRDPVWYFLQTWVQLSPDKNLPLKICWTNLLAELWMNKNTYKSAWSLQDDHYKCMITTWSLQVHDHYKMITTSAWSLQDDHYKGMITTRWSLQVHDHYYMMITTSAWSLHDDHYKSAWSLQDDHYKCMITTRWSLQVHDHYMISTWSLHVVPEQLNIKAVTGACKLIDGCSLALCLATVSVVSAGICHRNEVNSIAWLYRRAQPKDSIHYIALQECMITTRWSLQKHDHDMVSDQNMITTSVHDHAKSRIPETVQIMTTLY